MHALIRTMDAFLEWEDHSRNVASTDELECVGHGNTFKTGQKVRMWWEKKYYYGTVIETENVADMSKDNDMDNSQNSDDESEENLPRSHLIKIRKIDASQ